jgi:hypothetical protein
MRRGDDLIEVVDLDDHDRINQSDSVMIEEIAKESETFVQGLREKGWLGRAAVILATRPSLRASVSN